MWAFEEAHISRPAFLEKRLQKWAFIMWADVWAEAKDPAQARDLSGVRFQFLKTPEEKMEFNRTMLSKEGALAQMTMGFNPAAIETDDFETSALKLHIK